MSYAIHARAKEQKFNFNSDYYAFLKIDAIAKWQTGQAGETGKFYCRKLDAENGRNKMGSDSKI
ncbi:MAG: hypothetical protein AAFN77_06450 [Planctomycetota bacterium]